MVRDARCLDRDNAPEAFAVAFASQPALGARHRRATHRHLLGLDAVADEADAGAGRATDGATGEVRGKRPRPFTRGARSCPSRRGTAACHRASQSVGAIDRDGIKGRSDVCTWYRGEREPEASSRRIGARTQAWCQRHRIRTESSRPPGRSNDQTQASLFDLRQRRRLVRADPLMVCIR